MSTSPTANQSGKGRHRIAAAFAAITATLFLVGAPAMAMATSLLSTTRAQAFAAAAKEFGVPESVLLAVSYNETRWQPTSGVSVDGGYGLMDLRTYAPTITSGRDGSVKPAARQAASYYTLDQAANLLHESANTLKTNEAQNIRGGAAVLAQDARNLNGGSLPTSPNDWYSAVAAFGGANDATVAGSFADDVYTTIRLGASLTTSDKQTIALQAQSSIQPNRGSLARLGLHASAKLNTPSDPQTPECPAGLNCRFIPAAYAGTNPTDPTVYGNFDYANRPKDMQIRYIYIHSTEGSYDSAISAFQDPTYEVSANYVIRSSDGAITQMVPNEDVSWGIGNWNMNMHGINIEHEGMAAQGSTWYTEAMYQSSATLVRWLAGKYHIPLDREHIIGHDNVMRLPAAKQAAQHWDPGPFWDWNHYMDLIQGKPDAWAATSSTLAGLATQLWPGEVVTIAPKFSTNQPPVTDCQTGTCVTLPKQGASFVYLHVAPSSSAPLLSDPYLHTDGSAGTTQDDDWGDKAPSGFQYVVATTQGDWTGIWYAGQIGWFYNPCWFGRVAYPSFSQTITPRAGLSSVPVYTSAYPEASAYPAAIPAQPQNTPYTIAAGQSYPTDGQSVAGDYFYDETWNYSAPDDHAIVVGAQRYYEISFNHHVGFVKADDVTLR